MTRFSIAASFSALVVACAACGGSVDGAKESRDAGAGPDAQTEAQAEAQADAPADVPGDAQPDALVEAQAEAPPDAQVQLAGSYTLTFESVTTSPVSQPGMTARLDLLNDAGSLTAALTVQWSPPSPCTAKLDGAQLQLDCTADVTPSGLAEYDIDRWTAFVIPLSAQGGLGPAFSATGVYVNCGDDYCGSMDPTTGQGTVATDTHAPLVGAFLGGGGEPLLPWSTLSVEFSEPVEPQTAISHFEVSRSGIAVPVVWQPEFLGPTGSWLGYLPPNDEASTVWAGRMLFLGRLSTWDEVPGSTLSLATTSGITDRVGNAMLPISESGQVLDLNAPASSFDFDTAIAAGTWGPATLDSSQCESGGCLKLGPAASCTTPTGLAGLLPDAARTKMRIRYRAGLLNSWMSMGGGIELKVARPGLEPATVQLPELTYLPVDNSPDAIDSLSDWTTAEVALPAEVQSGQAGFSLAFTRHCIQWGEPLRVAWIESIVFE